MKNKTKISKKDKYCKTSLNDLSNCSREEIPPGIFYGGSEEIPDGGWRGGEEIPDGGWRSNNK